jgi:hypothetical protein
MAWEGLLFVACIAVPVAVQAQDKAATGNWQRGPRIDSVRAVVKTVERMLRILDVVRDSTSCDDGHVVLTATLYTDSSNVVRKFVVAGGSDESAGEERHYYDAAGTLRFTYAATNAVNGTRREDRYYYDETSLLVYHDQRLLEGPGYPGGFLGEPVRDPVAVFRAGCGHGGS